MQGLSLLPPARRDGPSQSPLEQGRSGGVTRSVPAGSGDETFGQVWPRMLAHIERFAPEFLILQCGADSIAGDPITHLRLSSSCHQRAARELCALADRLGHGRVLVLGGGGYDRGNLLRHATRIWRTNDAYLHNKPHFNVYIRDARAIGYPPGLWEPHSNA